MALLGQLMESLDGSGIRVFAFVNGELSGEAEAALEIGDVEVLRSEENVGLSAALNLAIEAAIAEGYSEFVLFDQDSSPEPCMLELLLERFKRLQALYGNLAVLGPQLLPPDGTSYLPLIYDWRRVSVEAPAGEVDFVPTSGSILSIEAWRQVGPFRDDYFIADIDVEWCFRAWSRGWRCMVAKDVFMIHRWGVEAPSHERSRYQHQIVRQSPVRLYYYIRNSVAGLRLSHFPFRWKRSRGFRLAAQIVIAVWQRPASELPRQFVWRAVSDGWRGRLGPVPADLARQSRDTSDPKPPSDGAAG